MYTPASGGTSARRIETEEEFGSLGELIDSIVEKTQKSFAKTLADLLDLGADGSQVTDPAKPPENKPKPAVEPVTAKRKISFL